MINTNIVDKNSEGSRIYLIIIGIIIGFFITKLPYFQPDYHEKQGQLLDHRIEIANTIYSNLKFYDLCVKTQNNSWPVCKRNVIAIKRVLNNADEYFDFNKNTKSTIEAILDSSSDSKIDPITRVLIGKVQDRLDNQVTKLQKKFATDDNYQYRTNGAKVRLANDIDIDTKNWGQCSNNISPADCKGWSMFTAQNVDKSLLQLMLLSRPDDATYKNVFAVLTRKNATEIDPRTRDLISQIINQYYQQADIDAKKLGFESRERFFVY